MDADHKGWILVPPPREDDDIGFSAPWRRRRVNGLVPFLILVTAVAIPLGAWYWWSSRHTVTPVAAVDPTALQSSGYGTVPTASPAVDSNVPPPDPDPDPTPPSAAPAAAVPVDSAVPSRPPKPAPRRIVASSAILEQQRFDQAEADREATARIDSLERQQAAQRVADSIAADRRMADSIAAVHEAEDRARQDEADRRAAEARLAEESAATAARTHDLHIAAGKAALSNWLTTLVSAVNSARFGDPVLSTGPPDFAAFAFKRQPTLSGATITGMTVTDDTGDVTAEWLAKWKTPFGPASSRKMKATARAIRSGEIWLVRSWNLTEGAP